MFVFKKLTKKILKRKNVLTVKRTGDIMMVNILL
jgi:hypothetical protein